MSFGICPNAQDSQRWNFSPRGILARSLGGEVTRQRGAVTGRHQGRTWAAPPTWNPIPCLTRCGIISEQVSDGFPGWQTDTSQIRVSVARGDCNPFELKKKKKRISQTHDCQPK